MKKNRKKHKDRRKKGRKWGGEKRKKIERGKMKERKKKQVTIKNVRRNEKEGKNECYMNKMD